jgi:hypothetical protein
MSHKKYCDNVNENYDCFYGFVNALVDSEGALVDSEGPRPTR